MSQLPGTRFGSLASCQSLTAVLPRRELYVHFLNNSIRWLIAPLREMKKKGWEASARPAGKKSSNHINIEQHWQARLKLTLCLSLSLNRVVALEAHRVSVSTQVSFGPRRVSYTNSHIRNMQMLTGGMQSCRIHLNNLFRKTSRKTPSLRDSRRKTPSEGNFYSSYSENK